MSESVERWSQGANSTAIGKWMKSQVHKLYIFQPSFARFLAFWGTMLWIFNTLTFVLNRQRCSLNRCSLIWGFERRLIGDLPDSVQWGLDRKPFMCVMHTSIHVFIQSSSFTNEKICTRTHFDKRIGNSEVTYTIYQIKTI